MTDKKKAKEEPWSVTTRVVGPLFKKPQPEKPKPTKK